MPISQALHEAQFRAKHSAVADRAVQVGTFSGSKRFPTIDDDYIHQTVRSSPEPQVFLNQDGTFESRIDTEEQDLRANMQRTGDIERLGAWVLTGGAATICLPVAASLSVVNLLKGEDFRLNTQMLSLSGLGVVLNSNGAFAQVLAALPIG
jgi:hypothetical protein